MGNKSEKNQRGMLGAMGINLPPSSESTTPATPPGYVSSADATEAAKVS